MKNILILFALFISIVSFTQEKNARITLQLESNSLNNDDSIFIVGNHLLLGKWNPAIVKMQNVSPKLWEITFELPSETNLEYKFTRGSWATEAANYKGMPLMNSFLEVKKDTTIKHKIDFWRNGEEIEVQGQITGQVEYLQQMKGEGILERDITVWLPPDYNNIPEKCFPVLYMNDGQNIIDPHTSSFKIDWRLDESADSLIKAGEIESLIIVGINSSKERDLDYSPGEKGEAYMKFIVHKLKPLIDSIYRTKADRKNTAIGGASMGGLISFMLHWNYNHIFGKAICMSSAFKYDDFDYSTVIKNDNQKKCLNAYIDIGDLGIENELLPGNETMLKVLNDKGYQLNKDYFWVKATNAKHFEKDWGIRMIEVFKLFYGK